MRRALARLLIRAAFGIALCCSALLAVPALAQDTTGRIQINQPQVEEIVVTAALVSEFLNLDRERRNATVIADLLGSEEIGRLGDSSVATALRRVPGLSLVAGKFVYVRGLGERYSSTTLNDAHVPSPDLSRSVLPLDIFPTSIVSSLQVRKTYSADTPAAFGGGHVDIRTKSIPDLKVYGFGVDLGRNTQTDGRVMTYAGGNDDDLGTDDGTRALPGAIREGLADYGGDIGLQSILFARRVAGDNEFTLAEAKTLNRNHALLLNRDLTIDFESPDFDFGLAGYFGDHFDLREDLKAGFLLSGNYSRSWAQEESINRNLTFPEERTNTETESIKNVSLSFYGSAGMSYADEEHRLDYTLLWLRDTDDSVTQSTFFNENREKSSGLGFQSVEILFEERELVAHQFRGSHLIGGFETKRLLKNRIPKKWLDRLPDDTLIDWYYSDATTRTLIPGQVDADFQATTDPNSGVVTDSQLLLSNQAVTYRFTDLEDRVTDAGLSLRIPLSYINRDFDIRLGIARKQQERAYEQLEFNLGPLSVSGPDQLKGGLAEVLSDGRIQDTDNDFVFTRAGNNNQSYLAATSTFAVFGSLDYSWQQRLHFSAGLRYESYQQVALDYSPYERAFNPVFFKDQTWHPALSFVWTDMWEDGSGFQLRLAYSKTVTRPDLREVTDASYLDPLTGHPVEGNARVTPASVDNFDARIDWYFESDNKLSLSLFYKVIDNPIELFESAASDTTVAREIVNAEAASLGGMEFEFLVNLGTVHLALQPFFVSGNLTLQSSELEAGQQADAPTHQHRAMVNAAPFVGNVQLGFNSYDARHVASLACNLFEERLFVPGRNGAPDGFEQPFYSLDFSYQWYPTNNMTVEFKARNLLDERLVVKRENVVVFEKEVGVDWSFEISWVF